MTSARTVPAGIMPISPSSGSCSTSAVALRVTTISSRCVAAVDFENRAADVRGRAGERCFRHRRDGQRRRDAEALEHREHDRAVAVALGRAQDRMDVGERRCRFADADVRRRLVRPDGQLHTAALVRCVSARKKARSIGRPVPPTAPRERSSASCRRSADANSANRARRAREPADRLERQFRRPLDVEAHAFERVGDVEIGDDEVGMVGAEALEHREAVGPLEHLDALQQRALLAVELAADARGGDERDRGAGRAQRARQREFEHRVGAERDRAAAQGRQFGFACGPRLALPRSRTTPSCRTPPPAPRRTRARRRDRTGTRLAGRAHSRSRFA